MKPNIQLILRADALLTASLGATLFLTGIVWVLQMVQFPMMLRAGGVNFPEYVREHRRRNTLLMAPMMLIELITAVWLLFVDRFMLLAVLPLVVIWIVTFVSIIPIHSRLARGYDEGEIRKLVRRNWVRTVCWSLRSVILLWLGLAYASLLTLPVYAR